MEILKPLISISLLGIILYAIGVILVEGGTTRKQILLPRSRKDRYRLNSISFSEFIFSIFLFAGLVFVYPNENDLIKVPAFWALIIALFIKFILMVTDTEKIRDEIIKARLGTKISFILLILWGVSSIFLLNHAKTDSEKILIYLIISYLFLITIFIKATLAHNHIEIKVDIVFIDENKISNRELLDETNEALILGNGEFKNTIILKNQVKTYEVYTT